MIGMIIFCIHLCSFPMSILRYVADQGLPGTVPRIVSQLPLILQRTPR